MDTRPAGQGGGVMDKPGFDPNYMRDTRLRSDGMRKAAEIVRSYRPASACTCGSYLSFRGGVPGHLSGCPVGECLDIADEIDGRADEMDLTGKIYEIENAEKLEALRKALPTQPRGCHWRSLTADDPRSGQ